MKQWGVAISALYAVVVTALAFPLWVYLWADSSSGEVLADLFDPQDTEWGVWVFFALFVATQAALLFISVDFSGKRLKPRRSLAAAVTATSFAVAIMSLAILANVIVMFTADAVFDWLWFWIAVPAGLWVGWGIVFFLYRERMSAQMTRTVGWLLNGSVLQLLVAVPTHIVVRERNDCCAPAISGFGIASGIALMLMAFGPSVAFLYQDRLRRHERRSLMPLFSKWPVWTLVATLIVGGAILWSVMQRDEPPQSAPTLVAPAAENP